MEQNVKKRDWVKNAAIIFLAVMLVLTFFSNTILNRTLPEVVTRYVEPGSIDSKVRVSGTVSARENYDVIIDQTRKVAAVNVKLGQEVSTGDVLFTLESGESDELETAKKDLESLEMEYQRSLLNATGGDYSRENRNIEQAREALNKAIANRDGLVVAPEALDAAAETVAAAEAALEEARQVVKEYAQQIKEAQFGRDHSAEGAGQIGGVTSEMRTALAEAEAVLRSKENDLRAVRLVYGVNDAAGAYFGVKRIAMDWIVEARRAQTVGATPLTDAERANILAYMDQELSSDRKITLSEREQAVVDLMPYYMKLLVENSGANEGGGSRVTPEMRADLESAEAALRSAENDLRAARQVYGVNTTNGTYYSIKRWAMNRIIQAGRALALGNTPLTDAEKANILAYMDQELESDRKITPTEREQSVIDLMPYYMEMLMGLPGEDLFTDPADKEPYDTAYSAVKTAKAAYAAAAEAVQRAQSVISAAEAETVPEPDYFGVPCSESVSDAQKKAYAEVSEVKAAYTAALENVESARETIRKAEESARYDAGTLYNGKTHTEYEEELLRLEPLADAAQELQSEAEEALSAAKADQQKLFDQRSSWEIACSEVESAQRTLEDLLFSLSEQQKSDGKSQALEALSRQELQGRIAEAKERVESLSGSTVTEVRSKVNGTVASLSVSAGHKAEAEKTLATIEVKDLGYTMTATVSVDQAKLLHVGDTASVSNYYWGSRTTAVLSGIQPDPKDPRTSRVLTFDIAGDISSGDSVSFSIGEKNASYDLVVPNSAVRSDTNGSFVLMITAKNSPLGNRYFATRVDVEVIASDDYNSAVKGALSNMDSIITTSSGNAPVKNGDQVRLADMN